MIKTGGRKSWCDKTNATIRLHAVGPHSTCTFEGGGALMQIHLFAGAS